MIPANLALKLALVAHQTPAYRVALQIGIAPDRLSKFISGLAHPTESEKQTLAKILNRSEDEIFPPRVQA